MDGIKLHHSFIFIVTCTLLCCSISIADFEKVNIDWNVVCIRECGNKNFIYYLINAIDNKIRLVLPRWLWRKFGDNFSDIFDISQIKQLYRKCSEIFFDFMYSSIDFLETLKIWGFDSSSSFTEAEIRLLKLGFESNCCKYFEEIVIVFYMENYDPFWEAKTFYFWPS